jgi:branched-subunit amino acid aminotransferase/4-amino-4-deoxychorismate lyase
MSPAPSAAGKPEAAAAIAWIDQPDGPGLWGAAAELAVPLADRGLMLGEGLFETVLVEAGRPQLLQEHLERWQRGARLLGLAAPPSRERVELLLAEALARSGIGSGALRLNWSGGSGGPGSRGLEAMPHPDGAPSERFWLQLTALEPQFNTVSTVISAGERRNPASQLSRCKSFNYAAQLLARREARRAGADEALMLSIDGSLCCGAAANLLVQRQGVWLTPPLASGCLPGVMRAQALRRGLAEEAVLGSEDLERSEAALLLNSLSCRPIRSCAGQSLPAAEPGMAAALWRSLLAREP